MKQKENMSDAYTYAHRAETYRITGFMDQALEGFIEAIEASPNYAWAYAHRGATYATLGNYIRAIKDMDKAIDLYEAQGQRNAWVFAHRGEVYRLRANNSRYKNNDAAVEADIHQAIDDFTVGIKYNNDIYPWAYAHRAATYRLQLSRYDSDSSEWKSAWDHAVTDLDTAIEQNSTYAWAYAFRCTVKKLGGKYESAMDDLEVALGLDRSVIKNPESETAVAALYAEDWKNAYNYGQVALKKDSSDTMALYCVAVAHEKLQKTRHSEHQHAQAVIREAITINLCSLAGLEILNDHIEQAKYFLCKAFEADPGYAQDRIGVDPVLRNFDFNAIRDCPQYQPDIPLILSPDKAAKSASHVLDKDNLTEAVSDLLDKDEE